MSQDTICPDHEYLVQMKAFPCTFNLKSLEQLTLSRLRYIKHNLVSELHIGNDSQEELIRKRNLLTLVYFRLGERNKALDMNRQVVRMAQSTNITSLANRCFLQVSIGDEPEAKRCLRRLKDMRHNESRFNDLLTEAYAEQAYCYSRLGGTDNLRSAIRLFTLVVRKRPNNFLWKFGLGLVCRRATHTNIYCSSIDRLDVGNFHRLALEYLFDVAENADNNSLRAMACAQLVKIRQDHPEQLFPYYQRLLGHQSILQLCNTALSYGQDIPSVLTQCGRSLLSVDLKRAVHLLEKSASIKRSTITYHYLGIGYKMLAEQAQTRKVQSATLNQHRNTASKLSCVNAREFMRSVSCDCGTQTQMVLSTCNISYLDDLHLKTDTVTNGRRPNKQWHDRPCGQVDTQAVTDIWRPREEVKTHVAGLSPAPVVLSINDRFVKRAIWCYKRAIDLSNGENLPAILDLGIILRQAGQLTEALRQFNSVTNCQMSVTGHRVTVISAYEQAGLCYLELSHKDANQRHYQQDAFKKLTRAITLASGLAKKLSELSGCARDIWLALRTLLQELDSGPQSTQVYKQKIRLMELAQDHGHILEAVHKLRDLDDQALVDKDISRSALVSYLELGQSENALSFLNMLGQRSVIGDLNWWQDEHISQLRSKVLLLSIRQRLKEEGKEAPIELFQQLFQLNYGTCHGMEVKEMRKQIPPGSKVGDVLIVYDDDPKTEDGGSRAMMAAHSLAHISAVCFGLQVAENLQATGEYGPRVPLQLQEMRRYHVVLVVLGDEPRDPVFEAMLESAPYNQPREVPDRHRILVVDAGLPNGQVPACLKQFDSLKLEGVGLVPAATSGSSSDGGEDGGEACYPDIKERFFRGSVDAILTLFCFLTQQTWPCP